MNLSKSRYCNGLQCLKMLWLLQYKPEYMEETANESTLTTGNMIHEVARYLYPDNINISYNDNLNEMIKDTYATIESYKDVVITEASFNYDGNFCSVDILIKKGNSYQILEVKSSTKVKDIYINDASYQYYVLNNLGFKVDKVSIVVINTEYVREGNLELDKLFKQIDITSDVLSKQEEISTNIHKMKEITNSEFEPQIDIGYHCVSPYECPFFKYCTKFLPPNNVFNIRGITHKNKFKYYQNGIISYEDLLNSNITKDAKMQIEYELNNLGDYLNKDNLKTFLKTLTYPLYYLDFETIAPVIPKYDGMHPYEKLPFQYSLHYEESSGARVQHKEFLAPDSIDPRRSLAESLVNDIPLDVTILAYNMSFEKSVIKSLAKMFPDLSIHLMNIHDHIKDLMIPFKNKDYYNREMQGSYSIKYVLPALFKDDPELDYHNLDLVHNGSEAMDNYEALSYISEEEKQYVRDRLLKYCELDTYAMVKILKKIKEKVK